MVADHRIVFSEVLQNSHYQGNAVHLVDLVIRFFPVLKNFGNELQYHIQR